MKTPDVLWQCQSTHKVVHVTEARRNNKVGLVNKSVAETRGKHYLTTT